MPHPLGVPPAGPPPMGPPPGGPPDAKRQRTGGLVLEPEEEFLAKYPGPSKVLHFACCLRSTCMNYGFVNSAFMFAWYIPPIGYI